MVDFSSLRTHVTTSHRARGPAPGVRLAIVLSVLLDVVGLTPAEAWSQDAAARTPLRVVTAGSAPFVMADAGGVQIHYSTFARPGAQILLGIALLFGARGLSAMLVRVRTAG